MPEINNSKSIEYNPTVLDAMSREFCVTKYYIRKAVRGEVPSETGDMLRKKYHELVREVEKTLKAKTRL